jgi:F-type H+-transporting ATPase subunit c
MRRKDPLAHTDEGVFCGGWSVFRRGAWEKENRLAKEKGDDMTGSLHVGLAALGAALGVGLIGMGASIAVGRNPLAATKVMVQAILAIAFAEAIVFYALFLAR